ncbi:MAG: carboxypeptidase-like regulatory domain-containing protein [Bacteroidia bacterium]|nr:carboxypeptidase-like regulatory domain-containing protein [Bacteroidia bacterium]
MIMLLTAFAAQAQTGKIAGKIIDQKTGEEILGATVVIEGTSFGAATDYEGKFSINNVKPGKYNLIISFISYQKKTISGVEVKANEVTQVNTSLSESKRDLNEVVITGELKKENASALLIQQKRNISISDGVSADMIKRTPDATTSDVMKRVSGTSIQDNKFAIIRGLNDRYNVAYINGAPLPSTESDRKAFSFDIFPSGMIDNMVITKSASPDLPGDFAGGLITINTKDIPEKRFVSASLSGSSHSLTTGKAGFSYEGGNTDWLGIDDGKRALPSGIPARGEFNNQSNEQFVNSAKQFNSSWATERIAALPVNSSFQVSGGNSYKMGKNNEFGFIVSGSHSNSYRNSYVERNSFNNPMGKIDNQIKNSYMDSITKREVLAGAMLNMGLKLGNKHKISFKNSYIVNSEDNTILRSGNDDYLTESLPLMRGTFYNYSESRLLTQQLIGDHFINSLKIKANWVLNNNIIQRNIPDFRRFTTTANLIDPGANDGVYTNYAARISSSNPDITQMGRFFSKLDETIRSAAINLSIPADRIKIKGVKTSFKTGALYQVRSRDFEARAFAPILNQNTPGRQAILEASLDTLFAASRYTNNFFFKEDFRAQDVYSASSKLAAAYLMADQKIGARIRMSYGVRLESYRQQLNSFELNSNPPKPLKVDTVFNDILPSLNFTYELNEKTNLRFSASRSVARPEFREIAPFQFYDFNLNSVVTGNPALVRTRIDNYDVRYEFYPGEGQMISASAFYKKFTNPIEVVYEFPGSDLVQGYSSDAKANNYGFEIELRKNFDFVDKWMSTDWAKRFSVTFNYAYILSKVELNQAVSIAGNRPLQGQSPYILNGSFQYYNEKSNLAFALFINRIGRRIAFVREKNGLAPDMWENPRTVIDLSISKRFYNKFEAKLGIGDLLAQDLVFYQDNNENGKLDNFNKAALLNPATSTAEKTNMDNVIFRYKMGYTISAGVSYKF